MKKFCFLFLALPLLANDVQEADTTSALDGWGGFRFVSLTPTNMVCKFPPYGSKYWISRVGIVKRILEYDEVFTIPLDQEVTFHWNEEIIYTPILLANQQKGFRIAYWGQNRDGDYVANVLYVALSDPPVRVDESEVVMIWKDGKFWPLDEYHAIIRRENEEAAARMEAHNKFCDRVNTAADRYKEGEEREAFLQELLVGRSTEEILTYLDELEKEVIHDVPPPPLHPASRAWLWLLALPAVAGVWFVVHLRRR